jgi:hypothetical protein
MSTTAKNNSNTSETINSISEAEDMKMFQAARRSGRRNALGDLSEHLAQSKFSFSSKFSLPYLCFCLGGGFKSSSDVDKMAPHFQSMSIKH